MDAAELLFVYKVCAWRILRAEKRQFASFESHSVLHQSAALFPRRRRCCYSCVLTLAKRLGEHAKSG